MTPAFDIFRVDQDGALIWCEAAISFEVAKSRIRNFAAAGKTAEFIIFDQKTQERVVVAPLKPSERY